MVKVLVTGAKGQLSSCIELLYSDNQEVDYQFYSIEDLDITKTDEIESVFSQNQFDYCINCAAYTNVDGAESNRETAFLINDTATAYLAEACKKHKAILIHISTDYVFDGMADKPYLTTDVTKPINVYGESKLEGELRVKDILDRYFIIRGSWLFSDQGHNFVKTISRLVSENKELKIVDSQFGSPTSCYELAKFIHFLIQNRIEEFGTYHFSASNHTNWYLFAKKISEYFPAYPKGSLKPTDHYPTAAQRPTYSVMDISKTKQIYDHFISWEDALDVVMKKLLDE